MAAVDADSAVSREETIWFEGPAGRLEGRWRPPRAGSPPGVLVVCHPHPAYGGTMLNKVVFHTSRGLHTELGVGSLRFNFRGVGGSEGAYDEGRGEVEDVRAAWREARRRSALGPLLAAGFSFGAAMTLRAAAVETAEPPDTLVLLGLPAHRFPLPDPFPLPIVAAHGAQDEFTPAPEVAAYLGRWPANVTLQIVPDADHFFTDRIPQVIDFLARALRPRLTGV